MKGSDSVPKYLEAGWAPIEELVQFVKSYNVRSVREYQSKLKEHHLRDEYLNLPINARKVYQTKWVDLLFPKSKYASY